MARLAAPGIAYRRPPPGSWAVWAGGRWESSACRLLGRGTPCQAAEIESMASTGHGDVDALRLRKVIADFHGRRRMQRAHAGEAVSQHAVWAASGSAGPPGRSKWGDSSANARSCIRCSDVNSGDLLPVSVPRVTPRRLRVGPVRGRGRRRVRRIACLGRVRVHAKS